MWDYHTNQQSDSKFKFSVVPLNKICINLEAYKIQDEVSYVAMENSAY